MNLIPSQVTPLQAIVGVLLALILGITAYFYFQESRQYKLSGFMSDKALANPYLALQRYLKLRGITYTRTNDLAVNLTDSSPSTTTIYLPAKPGLPTSDQIDEVLEWVKRGGTLLYQPNLPFDPNSRRANDRILEEIGVRYIRQNNRDLRFLASKRRSFAHGCTKDINALSRVSLNDIVLAADLSQFAFFSRKNQPLSVREKVLTTTYGKGSVVLVPSDVQWRNNFFFCHDNAELLYELVTFKASFANKNKTQFVWLESPEYLWLTDRLLRDYPIPIAVAFAMLVLWIWKSVVRQQQVFPTIQPRARSMRDYIVALADFHWKGGRAQDLLKIQRDRILANEHKNPERAITELAKHKNLTRSEIDRAIFTDPGTDQRQFLAIQKTLNKLRQLR